MNTMTTVCVLCVYVYVRERIQRENERGGRRKREEKGGGGGEKGKEEGGGGRHTER